LESWTMEHSCLAGRGKFEGRLLNCSYHVGV
jgi:hypothetical protein